MLNALQEMSDEKLMELYQIGDLYAFNVLYQRYEHKIYGYFHRFFPEERCADLLQETFLKVHRSRSRYKTSLPFSKWLFVIACNLAKDEFKRLSRLKEYLDDGQLENTQTFLVDPETPESIVEHDELWERIQQAILDLPENHREVIIQSKYEGKSYPEIAESMDITVGAVKQRVYRGLLTLREKLKDLVEPEFKVKAKKGFSGIMIFKFQGIIKKVLMGGLEAMKISAKVKIVTIGVAAVLILGGTGVIVWHNLEQSTFINSINQVVDNPKAPINQSPVKKTVSSEVINKPMNESGDLSVKSEQDKRASETIANPEMTESNTNIPVEEKTPAEILKKYNAILSSPEFLAEARSILIPGRLKIYADTKKIEELKNKEKELENNLQTTSEDKRRDIENELAKTKDEIWETRVNIQKQFILDDDAVQKLKLKYITVEEIRIAQQELRKTPPPFPLGNSEDNNTEEGKLNSMARNEAVKRLKADGWTPNPLRSYQ